MGNNNLRSPTQVSQNRRKDILKKYKIHIIIAILLIIAFIGWRHFNNPERTLIDHTFYITEDAPTSYLSASNSAEETIHFGSNHIATFRDKTYPDDVNKASWKIKNNYLTVTNQYDTFKINIKNVTDLDDHHVFKLSEFNSEDSSEDSSKKAMYLIDTSK